MGFWVNSKGTLLNYTGFIGKYNLHCSQREFNKMCRVIPLPSIHLTQTCVPVYNNASVFPNLFIEGCVLTDKRFFSNVFKSRLFHDYCRRIIWHDSSLVNSTALNKAYSKFMKWQVKETHFKIINKIYVAEFLEKKI